MNDELAVTELLHRTEAAADLIALTEYTFPRYQTALIHRKRARRTRRDWSLDVAGAAVAWQIRYTTFAPPFNKAGRIALRVLT
jgi:hypothetical protein